MSYSARRDTGLLAFAGSALATELVMYCATKKTPEESTQELKLPAPGSQSPCLADVTNLKTIRKAPGRGKEKDKRAARRRGVGGGYQVRESPGQGWTAGPPGRRQLSTGEARVASLLCAPQEAPLRRLSRPPGTAATGCGDRPALRPRRSAVPRLPGTHSPTAKSARCPRSPSRCPESR